LSTLKFNRLIIIIAFVSTIFLIFIGGLKTDYYNIKAGDVSPRKIKTPKRIENTFTTNENRELAKEAADKLIPITEKNLEINTIVLQDIDNFFNSLDDYRQYLDSEGLELTDILLQSENDTLNISEKIQLEMFLTNENMNILANLSKEEFVKFKQKILSSSENILNKGFEEMDAKTIALIKEEVDDVYLSNDIKNIINQLLINYLKPNIIVNEEATAKAKEERGQDYVVVFYLPNQVIVDEGRVISEEAFEALKNLGYVGDNISKKTLPIIGISILVFFAFFVTIHYTKNYHMEIINNKKHVMLIFTIYILLIISSWALIDVNFYFIPILLCTLIMAMLFSQRLALMFNLFVTLICFFINQSNLSFIIFFALSGCIITSMAKLFNERSKIIVVISLSSVANLSIASGVFMYLGNTDINELKTILIIVLLNGIISIIVGYGSLPIWEAVFGVLTTNRLMDLSNPNNELLTRLVEEAPGTYHHSLIVANLASAAAFDIGARADIARVGAYYHDIGKLKTPTFFYENIVGENPHDSITPLESMKIITNHSICGLELAVKYKLPEVIKDIIVQHHGNTVVKYFYLKHKEQNPNEEVNENDFRYEDNRPISKESSIVMLADTVEAAVRSIINTGKSYEDVELFVRKLIKDKVDDGQLEFSIITLGNIETSIHSFMRVFKSMYHERIKYPEDKVDSN
jgi:cyclic-di-AMP phosphodiesterase PgpH